MLPTPSDLCISELDLSAPERLAVYEKALYQAFRKHPPGTFDTLWAFDPEQLRARILVPYAGQRIVVAEVAGELIGAVALNFDMGVTLQLERYGFSVPKEQGQTAEGLVLFSSRIMVGRRFVLPALIEATEPLLRASGIRLLWASCDKKHLLGYLQLGFRSIDKVQFNQQPEFLLQRSIVA